ncbi:hypothetical protein HOY82DRAFT_621969 [Tuber indicum]|nr:hypothetical protein HOY82DRAFT_621969 [Tuber indicum]
MALNLVRQLRFRQGFIPYYRATHFPRKLGHTAQRKAIDELIGEALTTHEAPKMSELERLASLETEVGIHRKTINDGFSKIEGWIKILVSIAGGTILSYEVMVYDIQTAKETREHMENTAKEMKEYLGKVVTTAEKRTDDKLEHLKLWQKSEMSDLKLQNRK